MAIAGQTQLGPRTWAQVDENEVVIMEVFANSAVASEIRFDRADVVRLLAFLRQSLTELPPGP